MAKSISQTVKTKNLFGQTPKVTNRAVDTFVSGQGQEKATQAKQLSDALNQVVGATEKLGDASTELDKARAVDAAYRSGEVKKFDEANPNLSIFTSKGAVEREYNIAMATKAQGEYKGHLQAESVKSGIDQLTDPAAYYKWEKEQRAAWLESSGYDTIYDGLGFAPKFEEKVQPYLTQQGEAVKRQGQVYEAAARQTRVVADIEAEAVDGLTQESWTALREQLKTEGYSPAEIQQALLTAVERSMVADGETGEIDTSLYDAAALLTLKQGKGKPTLIIGSTSWDKLREKRQAAIAFNQAAVETRESRLQSEQKGFVMKAVREHDNPKAAYDAAVANLIKVRGEDNFSEHEKNILESEIDAAFDQTNVRAETSNRAFKEYSDWLTENKDKDNTEFNNERQKKLNEIKTYQGREMFEKTIDIAMGRYYDNSEQIVETQKAIIKEFEEYFNVGVVGEASGKDVDMAQKVAEIEEFWRKNLPQNATPEQLIEMSDKWFETRKFKSESTKKAFFQIGSLTTVTEQAVNRTKPRNLNREFIENIEITEDGNTVVTSDQFPNLSITITETSEEANQ